MPGPDLRTELAGRPMLSYEHLVERAAIHRLSIPRCFLFEARSASMRC